MGHAIGRQPVDDQPPTIVLREIAVPAHQTVRGINANIANSANANNGERVRGSEIVVGNDGPANAGSALLALLSHARNGSAS
jgi:hypothetical protein